jgi:hypothetical protein
MTHNANQDQVPDIRNAITASWAVASLRIEVRKCYVSFNIQHFGTF